jgi:hypothetical protein
VTPANPRPRPYRIEYEWRAGGRMQRFAVEAPTASESLELMGRMTIPDAAGVADLIRPLPSADDGDFPGWMKRLS